MTIDLGVLISGRGSNLSAILAAIAAGSLDARVRVVISNKASAGGLSIARAAGVASVVIPHGDHVDRASFDRAVVAMLREAGATCVVLAGFMRIVTPVLLDAFPYRVVNIHPSLLPAFPGVDAQAQALAYGARITGCTVHLVDAGTDSGPVLAQAAVPILEGDTRDALAARILVHEHELLVRALGWLAADLVEIEPAAAGKRPIVRVRGVDTAFGIAPAPGAAR